MTDESSQKTEFQQGQNAWTRDGVKVYIDALTADGRYVVSAYLELGYFDPEEPPEDNRAVMVIVDELFAEPPRQLFDEKIAASKQDLLVLRAQVEDIRGEIHAATAERTRLVDKLKVVPALQYIELMLEGRLKFVVVERHGEYEISSFEEAVKSEDRFRAETRLVSLTVNFKASPFDGNRLQWQINKWHDGSGADYRAWFFETEEQAKEAARDKIEFALREAHRKFLNERDDGGYLSGSLVRLAKALVDAGGIVPDPVEKSLWAAKRKSILATIEYNSRNARSYFTAIDKAKQELEELGEDPNVPAVARSEDPPPEAFQL